MSVFTDQLAEHLTTLNEHFGETFTFQSRSADDIEFTGVLDNDLQVAKDTEESNRDDCDAKIHCVTLAQFAELQAAVPDFDEDGWITLHGERFTIVGVDRDNASVTLRLRGTKTKTLRYANPHGPGRGLQHK